MLAVAYSEVWEGDRKLYEKYLEIYNRSLAVLGSDGLGRGILDGGQGVHSVAVARAAIEYGGGQSGRGAEVVGDVDAIVAGDIDGRSGGSGNSSCVCGGGGVAAVGMECVSGGEKNRSTGETVEIVSPCRGDVAERAHLSESEDVSSPKVGKWKKKNIKRKENRRLKAAGVDVKLPGDVCGAGARSDNWRQPGVVSTPGRSEARETLEAKWIVENRLKAFEAERKLQLLKMQDVSEVAKLQERKIKAAGERAMVQIEKSHATLAATGNVPGVVPKGGYCTTVVDDLGSSEGSTPSCTISPDSSASMKEFKETHKKMLDYQKRAEDAEKLLRRREVMEKTTYAQSVAEFTAGSESVMSDGLKDELNKRFGESYEYEGKFEGKHVVRRTFFDGGMIDGSCDGLEVDY